jgi:WD40 repeat protein
MNGYVASFSNDSTVNVWNPNTGESIRQYTQHTAMVNSLDQFDEDTLVSGSFDMTIHIWKISSGEDLNKIDVGAPVYSIKLLSNGLIACGLERNINIYEYSTGKLTKTLSGHSSVINSLELLNDQLMASGSWDNQVFIWDLSTYSIKYTLSQHDYRVLCVKRLSSSLMASCDSIGQIIIWNWFNGSLVYRIKSHIGDVCSLDLYDDHTLISGSFDRTIKLWNISNGQLIKKINTDIPICSLTMLQRGEY